MSQSADFAKLAEKHQSLERQLKEAIESLGADDLEIARLKREKLRIKDLMARMTPATRH